MAEEKVETIESIMEHWREVYFRILPWKAIAVFDNVGQIAHWIETQRKEADYNRLLRENDLDYLMPTEMLARLIYAWARKVAEK